MYAASRVRVKTWNRSCISVVALQVKGQVRAWEAAMARLRQRTAFLCALVLGLLGVVALATAAEEGQASAAPLKLESVLGRDVSSSDGDGGRIIDLLVDRDGGVRDAVVEFGGFLGIGTSKIAIEWQAFGFLGRVFIVEC